jgi:HAD superfamily hydrolase (TIGR01509 family)
MNYDLVIFDCDGVLVDTERISCEVVSFLLKEEGLEVSPEAVAQGSTGLSETDMWLMYEAELGKSLPEDISVRLLSLESERFRTELRSMPGVSEAVRRLITAGIPICVASSGTLEKMVVTLGVTGLAGYFDGKVFSVSQVAKGKPAPDIYLLAAQEMGTPPSRCAVIEDSFPGAQAGQAAGMTVLGYCPDGDIWGLASLGIQTFNDMNGLPGLLGFERR